MPMMILEVGLVRKQASKMQRGPRRENEARAGIAIEPRAGRPDISTFLIK